MTAVVVLVAVQAFAFIEGIRLSRADPLIKLGAGPLVGHWDVRFALTGVPALVVAVAGVVVLPRLADRAPIAVAVGVSSLFGVAFTVLLAASDGWQAVVRPVLDPTEYWRGAQVAKPAGRYLRDYIADQHLGSIHVQGHPPGVVLALLGLRSVGLGSAWAAAAMSFIGVAFAVIGVSVTALRFGAKRLLRAALPFLAIAPYAVWQGTSMDAFFGGVAAIGIAALAMSMTTTSGRVRIVAGSGGGVVLGLCCFLTFGTPTLLPLIAVLAWRADRLRWVVPAVVGLAAVFAAFAALGYWWLDGLDNTRHFYAITAAAHRPYWYFLLANAAVLCIALGPAVLVGIGRLGLDRGRVIVFGALACALVADVSGLSKAETERIWLLYMPWIAVAAGAVASTWRARRWWLAAQAGWAIVIQAVLVSHW